MTQQRNAAGQLEQLHGKMMRCFGGEKEKQVSQYFIHPVREDRVNWSRFALLTETWIMKKQVFLLLALFCGLGAMAQGISDSFNTRLETYMKLNREARFAEIMDYVHPSLFQHVDREAMMQSFRQFYNNAQQRISIDSTEILSVSPVFKWHDTAYRKVDYKMFFTLRVKDSSQLNDPVFINKLTAALGQGFQGGKVYFN